MNNGKILCIKYPQYLFSYYIYYYSSIIFKYSNILATTGYNVPATEDENNLSLSETGPSKRYDTVITGIRSPGKKSSKTYEEKAKETEEKWNVLLRPLKDEYINCYKNGGPKCTDVTDFALSGSRFCGCPEEQVKKRAVTCFFYTGKYLINSVFLLYFKRLHSCYYILFYYFDKSI